MDMRDENVKKVLKIDAKDENVKDFLYVDECENHALHFETYEDFSTLLPISMSLCIESKAKLSTTLH